MPAIEQIVASNNLLFGEYAALFGACFASLCSAIREGQYLILWLMVQSRTQ